ncbi:hypothetical protein EMQ25_17825 [Arsenicitalea aurantiaca]|uniref:Uncharacterized protein n=1 Tax=Arsenicitalea aurantiaca TaxID=1783274 RepID=A0A433X1V0_9HYPH|nr:hypothetical protein [Arsenicitalea aurantiaca]RUT28088.1 hypothetical protein EMQ25_17825 [Arsenicitalea aurantiaca]
MPVELVAFAPREHVAGVTPKLAHSSSVLVKAWYWGAWAWLSCLSKSFEPDLLIFVQQVAVVELLNPSEMSFGELGYRRAAQKCLLTPMNGEPLGLPQRRRDGP